MQRGKLVLKLTAIVVAVGLGGVFIAYRAGAFQAPAPQPEPQPQSEVQPQASETPKTVTWEELTPEEREKIIMHGSKSAPILTPVSPSTGATSPGPQPTSTTQPAPSSPSYMGGSKTIILVEPKDVPKQPQQVQPTSPQAVKP